MRSMILVVLSGLVATPLPAAAGPPADSDLAAGVRQIQDGDLPSAVVTLDGVVRRLTPEAATRAAELSQALLHKGVALVLLGQEEPAKAAFREALSHDPALRLRRGEHPDRVVRVFEAARQGKTASVMQRPNEAPKRAGLGAAAIGGIVAGVAVLGGGAAVVASGSSDPTPTSAPPITPPPTPTPTAAPVLAPGTTRGTVLFDEGNLYAVGAEFVVEGAGRVDVVVVQRACRPPSSSASVDHLTRVDLLPAGAGAAARLQSVGCPPRERSTLCGAISLEVANVVPGTYAIGVERDRFWGQRLPCGADITVTHPVVAR